MIDIRQQAHEIAAQNGELGLEPVIMKELIHYQLFRTLSENGFLDFLTFQGGTSLRLCYHAPRFSEDLDFSGGRNFNAANFADLKECVEDTVGRQFGLPTFVKEPKNPSKLVKTWQIEVSIDPQHSDIPRQKVKIDIASIDAHDPTIRPIFMQFDQQNPRVMILPHVESLEEILADKIQAFTCSDYTRLRDIWDITWILDHQSIDIHKVSDLRSLKDKDYGQTTLYARRSKTIPSKIRQAFKTIQSQGELSRFLPEPVLKQTVENQDWVTWEQQQVLQAFSQCPPTVKLHRNLSR